MLAAEWKIEWDWITSIGKVEGKIQTTICSTYDMLKLYAKLKKRREREKIVKLCRKVNAIYNEHHIKWKWTFECFQQLWKVRINCKIKKNYLSLKLCSVWFFFFLSILHCCYIYSRIEAEHWALCALGLHSQQTNSKYI